MSALGLDRAGGLFRRPSKADLSSSSAPYASLRTAGPRPTTTPDLPWSVILRTHVADYVALIVLLIIVVMTENAPPSGRPLAPVAAGDSWWRYSFPLKLGAAQRVPAPAVLIIATGVPYFVLLAHTLLARPPRAEAHAAFLALAAALLTTGAATNAIKLGVGRPRPNFVERCWPGGGAPVFDATGVPVCSPGAVRPSEGRKSFPSGHSSWCASGLGYLSWWAAGKLRVWSPDVAGHPWRLVVAATPISLAVWVGITRLADAWHHVEDVACGLALGAALSYLCFRQSFHCFTSRRAGEAHATSLAVVSGGNGGNGNGGGSGSGAGLAGPSSVADAV